MGRGGTVVGTVPKGGTPDGWPVETVATKGPADSRRRRPVTPGLGPPAPEEAYKAGKEKGWRRLWVTYYLWKRGCFDECL